MEGFPGPSSEGELDRSRVLDIKPMRTLVPVFPNPPQAPPFICSSPFGPFPSGFTPFYPFSMAGGNEDGDFRTPPPTAAAVPLRSLGTPQMTSNGGIGSMDGSRDLNFEDGSSKKRATPKQKVPTQKKPRPPKGSAPIHEVRQPDLKNIVGLPQAQKEDGNRELVNFLMLQFDAVRRRLSQLEDANEASTGLIKRADLKAGKTLLTVGYRTNFRKRIGPASGVEVGDIFYFRMEMCVVGVHAQSMGGIDYMSVKNGTEDEPIAVSIVSSGGYGDDGDDKDVLIYTGQGGGNYKGKGIVDASDQKLERGNLALERSANRQNHIRVIRGIRDMVNPAIRIYVYDGIYSIQNSWIDKAQSGVSTFKYKLVRLPGQPSAFDTWQSILKWKEGLSSRAGLISSDITSGAESLPVSLVNEIDDEKEPSFFNYSRNVKYTKASNLGESRGCNCNSACAAGDPNCSCIGKNGGDFPYTANGVLVGRKPLLYECGPSCPCFTNCKNKASQCGIKVRMEVFKTRGRGWGLRSWDPIRSGTFICEYVGEVIDKEKYDNEHLVNDYIFDSTRFYNKSFKWNYDPPLVGETANDVLNEDYEIPIPVIINAKDSGNIARFMNHSCSPNVFWQPVVYDHNGESYIHIAFYAIRHIPPMVELTFDYGISQFENRRKQCFCGSQNCKGYFG